MATSQLKLTRDQLASFLKDHEQIRQFERLFADVQQLEPTTLLDLAIAAGNADQKAVEALDAVSTLAQQAAIDSGNADQKAVQALDSLNRIANALEMLAAAPVIENNNSVATDYVDHNISAPVPEAVPGRVFWSDDDATLDLHLLGGVNYQFGQQLDFHPKNTSGVQINKGMAVMATGVVGSSTKIECARAVANGTVAAQYMLGIATQNIPNNQFGYVAWFGSIRGFNTTGANKTVPEVWADGDILYFDPTYPGELTKTRPAAPALDLPIAIITNAANNGAIFVRMKTGESMDELHDVSAASPSSGNVLIYDAVQARWEANSLTAGTNIAITPAAGAVTIATAAAITADLTNNTGNLIDSSVGLTNGAGANAATLTNSPVTGNPTKWVPIDDNGTTRYIPCW
jgi:cellobiose-specific phosphotransferase system component IIA